jgi:hypothetical protein
MHPTGTQEKVRRLDPARQTRPEARGVTRPLHPGADNQPRSLASGGTRPLNWPGRC